VLENAAGVSSKRRRAEGRSRRAYGREIWLNGIPSQQREIRIRALQTAPWPNRPGRRCQERRVLGLETEKTHTGQKSQQSIEEWGSSPQKRPGRGRAKGHSDQKTPEHSVRRLLAFREASESFSVTTPPSEKACHLSLHSPGSPPKNIHVGERRAVTCLDLWWALAPFHRAMS